MLNLLHIDIETSPILMESWVAYEANALRIVRDWKMLGFAYAWGDGKIETYYPHATQRSKPGYFEEWDKLTMQKLWDLLDNADVVVAHNGRAFDVKKINAKLIEHGFGPPSHFSQIDTLREARKTFKFSKNTLDQIGITLLDERKLAHTGFEMWVGCMEGVEKEWNRMERYNKQDIALLRKVYHRMREWMPNHPNMLDLGETGCTRCGGNDFTKRGFRRTLDGMVYPRFQCKGCGGYMQGRKNVGRAGEFKNV